MSTNQTQNLDSLILNELVGLVEQSISRLRRSERGKKAIDPGEADVIQTQLDMLRRLSNLPAAPAKVEDAPVATTRRAATPKPKATTAESAIPSIATAAADAAIEAEMAKAEKDIGAEIDELEGILEV